MGINIITEKRALCRCLLHAGEIMNMRFVEREGTEAKVEAFIVETAATVLIPRPAALLPAEHVTEFLLDDLEMLRHRAEPLKEINEYLKAAGLYYKSGEKMCNAALIEIA